MYYAVYSLFWAEILENRFGFYHCLESTSLPCSLYKLKKIHEFSNAGEIYGMS
jgi:hypothetical protein